MVLAYFDLRPFWFLGGMLVVVLLALGLRSWLGPRWSRGRAVAVAMLVYTTAFGLFLTEYGPFVGRKLRKEFRMSWRVEPVVSEGVPQGFKQPGVRLEFVDFPGHVAVILSNDLLDHLQRQPTGPVPVVFEVTYDYGRPRGYREIEIAGLREWNSEFSWGGTVGNPERSPWD
jgi:hypothetical protein